MARGLERMIRYKIAHGGLVQAASDIEFAAKSNIPLSLSDPEAQQLYARVHAEQQARTRQFVAEGRRRSAASSQEESAQSECNETTEADVTRLTKVQPGMSQSEVSSILGRPHKIDQNEVPAIPQLGKPARRFTSWTYNPAGTNFIVLTFENGRLIGGGSGGYDVSSGLKVPQQLIDAINDK